VVAGSLDKLVSITDAEERVPLKVLEGHSKGVTSVDWSPLYKFVCRWVFFNPSAELGLVHRTNYGITETINFSCISL